MIEWALKQVHIIDHLPDGDIVEIETVGGYLMKVDPITHKATDKHQRFKMQVHTDGSMDLAIVSPPDKPRITKTYLHWRPPVIRGRHER